MTPLISYLHEDKPATTPFVYDFQEPFRWLVDYTLLRMVLSRAFSWDDFYFTGAALDHVPRQASFSLHPLIEPRSIGVGAFQVVFIKPF